VRACVRVSVCLSDTILSSAKRLNRSMCRSVVDSGRPTEPCIMTGTKSPSTTRVLFRGSSWAFPDVWAVDIYSTYWRYSPGGSSDVASGYQYCRNLFMLLPLLLMVIVTMMVMLTLWLLCRLHDDNCCIISSWCSRFHRSHCVVSVPQARVAFHVRLLKKPEMLQLLTSTVITDNSHWSRVFLVIRTAQSK